MGTGRLTQRWATLSDHRRWLAPATAIAVLLLSLTGLAFAITGGGGSAAPSDQLVSAEATMSASTDASLPSDVAPGQLKQAGKRGALPPEGAGDPSITPSAITVLGMPAAGAYHVDWTAADPERNKGPYLPTYPKVAPTSMPFGYPMTGRRANPMPDAVAYAPSGAQDSVNSLAPGKTAMGAVIPFEMVVTVDSSPAAEDGVVTVQPRFSTKTTSGDNFGYDPAWGVIAAFVDTADAGTTDPGADATVSNLQFSTINGGTSNEAILAAITVSGLDSGDRAVVEIWVVLKDSMPEGASGNVPTSMVRAETGSVPNGGDEVIRTGNQTVPLMKVGDLVTLDVDLATAKSDTPDPVRAGDRITYTVTVTNQIRTGKDSYIAHDVTVHDVLGAGLAYDTDSLEISGATFPTDVTWGDGEFTVTIDAMDIGQTVTLTFDVIVADEAPQTATAQSPADIHDRQNFVEVSSFNPEADADDNSDTEYTGVRPAIVPEIEVTIEPDPASRVEPGGLFTFEYRVFNSGDTTVTVTRINDDQLGDIALPSTPIVLAPNAWSAPLADTTTYSAVGTYIHVVTAWAEDRWGQEATNTDSTSVEVIPRIDLSIAKSDTPDPVRAGSVITYTLVVRNNSAIATSTNTIVTDVLGEGLTYVPDSVTIVGAMGPTDVDMDGQTLTIAIGGLAPSSTATVTLDALVALGAPMTAHVGSASDIHDRVNAASVAGDFADPNASNNIDLEYTGVMPIRHTFIQVVKQGAPAAMFEPGGEFTYTYTVSNVGSDTVTVSSLFDDVIGELDLPFDVTLEPGETMQSVTATWTYTEPGGHRNTVTVVCENEDGDTCSDTDTASVEVFRRLADLSVTKLDSADPARAGSTLTYTITASNESTLTAFDAVVTDTLGAGMTFVPGSVEVTGATGPTGDAYVGGVLTVTLGDMAAGQTVTITFQVTVDSGSPMTAHVGSPANIADRVNTVVVSSATDDPDPSNNLDIEYTGIMPIRHTFIALEKVANPLRLGEPGGEFSYTYTVSNVGSDTVAVTSLTDDVIGAIDLPFDVTLEPGESMESVVATWTYDAIGIYRNVATATALNEDGDSVNATAAADVEVYQRLTDLAVNFLEDSDATRSTNLVTFTLIASNESTFTGRSAMLVNDLSAGLEFVPGTITVAGAPGWAVAPAGTHAWALSLGDMVPSQVATITFQAKVLKIVPTPTPGPLPDRYSVAVISCVTSETTLANNTDTEYTGAVPIEQTGEPEPPIEPVGDEDDDTDGNLPRTGIDALGWIVLSAVLAAGAIALRRGADRRALSNVLAVAALAFPTYYLATNVFAWTGQSLIARDAGELTEAAVLPPSGAGDPAGPNGATLDWSGYQFEDLTSWEKTDSGEALWRIVVPTMNLSEVVVRGASLANLRMGPAWISTSDLPGITGNVAISGHRTTYGAPFGRLAELEPGDSIYLYSAYRRYRYEVTGTQVVRPNQIEVTDSTLSPTITLIACHPRFSARQRLVVRGALTEVLRTVN